MCCVGHSEEVIEICVRQENVFRINLQIGRKSRRKSSQLPERQTLDFKQEYIPWSDESQHEQ